MSTRDRVPCHTSRRVNETIFQQTVQNVDFHSDSKEQITRRLKELDHEWDIERMLGLNSSALSLMGLALGFLKNRRWFLLPLTVQSFYMQHAIQGWCPPLPLLRRMGFRTLDEINQERMALKALRGDFKTVSESSTEHDRVDRATEALLATTI